VLDSEVFKKDNCLILPLPLTLLPHLYKQVLSLHCHCFFQLLFVYFLLGCSWGVEFRVLHLLGRNSTTWTTLPAFFVFVIFDIGSCFMPKLAWTIIFLLVHSLVADMTGVAPHVAVACNGVLRTFCLGWLWTVILPNCFLNT
jgi:hypothetical protein